MPNKELIQKKINKIGRYMEELRPLLVFEPSVILGDYTKLRTVERNFQLMVDTIIDINTHIISQENMRAPEDATDTFLILGETRVLPMEFVLKFSPVVGLRNKIVHDYDDIDVVKLINDIEEGISQFDEYAVHIDSFMQKM